MPTKLTKLKRKIDTEEKEVNPYMFFTYFFSKIMMKGGSMINSMMKSLANLKLKQLPNPLLLQTRTLFHHPLQRNQKKIHTQNLISMTQKWKKKIQS
jgi:hypothetical protein